MSDEIKVGALHGTPDTLNGFPDIASEADVARLRVGSQFYARFIMDPQGDSVRWAKDHIDGLKVGRVSRWGIGKNYWINGTYLERPPLATSKGNGKFTVTED